MLLINCMANPTGSPSNSMSSTFLCAPVRRFGRFFCSSVRSVNDLFSGSAPASGATAPASGVPATGCTSWLTGWLGRGSGCCSLAISFLAVVSLSICACTTFILRLRSMGLVLACAFLSNFVCSASNSSATAPASSPNSCVRA